LRRCEPTGSSVRRLSRDGVALEFVPAGGLTPCRAADRFPTAVELRHRRNC